MICLMNTWYPTLEMGWPGDLTLGYPSLRETPAAACALSPRLGRRVIEVPSNVIVPCV